MISLKELKSILANDDPAFIESLAQNARDITIQNFGRAISLYAPLYLSNFCDNQCVYCGYNRNKQIKRKRLTLKEMHKEMKKVSASGIQNILLLTGESREMTSVDYLILAVNTAKEYFPGISLEVYPLEENEYRDMFLSGVDGVTIYQETYNKEIYKRLHIAGKKRDYNYRFETPERIAKSGIRMINMGILLGLSEVSEDIFHLFSHLEWMGKNYPAVEYSLSFPRLIPINHLWFADHEVSDLILIKLICLARIFFPRVGINLSTRERPYIRDHALPIGITKISAASRTCVGGYSLPGKKEPQFNIMDNRSVDKVVTVLKQKGFDPVFTDWRRIPNEL